MSDYQYSPPPPDTSVKVVHLVFGMLFLGFAGLWALVAAGIVDTDTIPALGPALLIAAGAVGLVASLANGRNQSRRRRAAVERAARSDSYIQTFDADDHDGDRGYDEPDDRDHTQEIR